MRTYTSLLRQLALKSITCNIILLRKCEEYDVLKQEIKVFKGEVTDSESSEGHKLWRGARLVCKQKTDWQQEELTLMWLCVLV